MTRTDLGRIVIRNTCSQIFGRNVIALCRLAVAALIVRTWGKVTFGEYALIFGLLSIGEWLLDFGTTEICVREICRYPDQEQKLMRTLAAGKFIQLPAAVALLIGLLFALRYPLHIIEAGIVGAFSLVFFAGMLIYHTIFKARLAVHREVLAELLSVLIMIPLVWTASLTGWGLSGLLGCHVLSRASFFGFCCWFGRNDFRLSVFRVRWADIAAGLRTSATVGFIGFLVVSYEALDVLALSKLSKPADLAYYSAAQRLVWPIVIALSSVGATLYPLVASYWPHDRLGFENASQRALNVVLLLAGAAACCAFAGAQFLMGLLGRDLVEGAVALRIFALLLMVKAVTATVGPVLYVLHAQRLALRFIVVAVAVKCVVVLAVAPRYGYIGVATAALVVECLFAAIPSVAILQARSGYQVQWGVPARLMAVTVSATALALWLLPGGGLGAAVAAGSLYLPFAFSSGAVNTSDLKLLLNRRAA
jgi:O-antigen/teichoic acid export membrane protein